MSDEDKKRFVELSAEIAAESIVLFYHLKKVIALVVIMYNELYPDSSIPFKDRRKIIVDLLNEYIDIPWIPEWMEDKLIGTLIDEAIRVIDTKPKISVEDLVEEMCDE